MAGLDKQLNKFSPKERTAVEKLAKRILEKNFIGLNLKKLKGFGDIFRIRKGKIRIIFELKGGRDPLIIAIERRKEDTYKL